MKAIAILTVATLLSAHPLVADPLDLSTHSDYVSESISLTDLLAHIQKETQSIVDPFSAQDFNAAIPSLQNLNEHLLILSSIPKDYLAADPLLQEDLLSCRTALLETFCALTPDSPEAQSLQTTLDLFTESHTYPRSTESSQAPQLDEDLLEIIQSSVNSSDFDLICLKNSRKQSLNKTTSSTVSRVKSFPKKAKEQGYQTLKCTSSKTTSYRDPQILLIRSKSKKSGGASGKASVKAKFKGKDGVEISGSVEGEYEDKHGNYVKGSLSREEDGCYAYETEAGKKKQSSGENSEEE